MDSAAPQLGLPQDVPAADIDASPFRATSILLAEDIDINQEIIAGMLVSLGHEVEVVCDGAEALDRARRLSAEPRAWDLIFMDVRMPVMDGITATRAIRALGGRAGAIPIVALTASALAGEIQECLDAGMDDHVVKPSSIEQLKLAVERWSGTGCVPARSAHPHGDGRESLASRFEARREASGQRLGALIDELESADGDAATQLLAEAAGIAHIIAGTAGLFGQAGLGDLAHEVECEIIAVADSERQALGALAAGRLLTALDISLGRPGIP